MNIWKMSIQVVCIMVSLISTASAEAEKITITGGTGAFMGPLHIASVKGYFRTEGLDVALHLVGVSIGKGRR